MPLVGEEGVPETAQNADCKSLVGRACQVCTPSLDGLSDLTQARARTLSVHISRSNVSDLVKLLLPLLPNLHTLEVLTEGCSAPDSEEIFISVRLPQIRTLVVDAQAHRVMKCCTHVRKLVIHQRGFDVSCLISVPFVANSLVCLALCSPVPEIIQGVNILCYYYRADDSSPG